MPMAPASICLRAISIVLCPLKWGRQRDAMGAARRRDMRNIGFHPVEVDQERGRIKRGILGLAHSAARRVERRRSVAAISIAPSSPMATP